MEVHSKVVADLIGCSQVWIHKMRKAGEGPAYAKRGSLYFYPLGRVIRYVIESKTADLEGRLTVAEDTLARVHRAESLPEDAPSRAKLADRLAVVEKALAKIRRDQKRKRKPLVPILPS